jgi:hypothetical protein
MELHEMVHISGRVWIIKKSFKMFPDFSTHVARDFTIFTVYLLAIQHVISASGSLMTGTRAKSKRRLRGTTTCRT